MKNKKRKVVRRKKYIALVIARLRVFFNSKKWGEEWDKTHDENGDFII